MDWQMWAAVLGLATLIVTLAGIGLAQGRATRKSNEAAQQRLSEELNRRFEGQRAVLKEMDAKNEHAHAAITARVDGLTTRIDGLTTRIDGLTTRVDGLTTQVDGLTTRVDGLTTRVDGLTTRVESLTGRVDRLSAKVDVVAHDVAFLAGRQKERDQQGGNRRATGDKGER